MSHNIYNIYIHRKFFLNEKKTFFIFLLCFIVGVFITRDLSGQTYTNIKSLSKKDGLAQASVFAITQDNAGFLWFGTRYGLSKYDGYRFVNYTSDSNQKNPICGDDIRVLYNDVDSHKLWIGTVKGLSVYDPKTDAFTNFIHSPDEPSSISSNVVRAICKDKSGNLWIGTENGLNVFNEKNTEWTYINIGQKEENNIINAIINDKEGNLLVGTQNGLYKIKFVNESHQISRLDLDFKINDPYITCLALDDKDNLWIGTNDKGLNVYNAVSKTTEYYKIPDISNEKIRALDIDLLGNIWVGTFEGLNAIHPITKKIEQYKKAFSYDFGLSDNSIRSVFVDNRGSIWVGTYYGGVNHLDENYNQFQNIVNTGIGNSLSAPVVSSFAEDPDGNLWIGTEGGGLNFLQKKTNKFTYYKHDRTSSNSLAGNNVKQLLLDGNTLWIGTFNEGLDKFDLKSKTFKHFRNKVGDENSITDNNIYGFLKHEGRLWIISYGGGLNIMDLATEKTQSFRNNAKIINSLSSDYTRAILKSTNGTIWIGTSKGLNKVILNKKGLPDKFVTYLRDERVYGIHEDSDGKLWLGTETNGLFQFDPLNQKAVQFTKKDGLSGNSVYGIIEDKDHNFWISTNDGISKFNTKTKQFILFDDSNGLYNSEFNYNAYYKLKDGSILFGGTNGFTKFKPKDIKANGYIPPIVFSALKQNNELITIDSKKNIINTPINEAKTITFAYNDASFTIEFAALDYFSPQNNQFAFKLDGLDKTWNHTVGEASATYTIQKEGEYEFLLKVANSDGIWNEDIRRLNIVVLPPPYKTWWAYLIYLSIFSFGIYSLFRFFKLRNSIRLSIIEKQQQENLHQMKLKFFTNIAHEFRIPLTLIIGPLEELIATQSNNITDIAKSKLNKIYSNSERMLRLVNQLMTFRRIETGNEPMSVSETNISDLVEDIFTMFDDMADKKNINYYINIKNKHCLAWVDQEKIEKVIFNLLSNAFKFTPIGGNIDITVEQKNKDVIIKVTDSGIGIHPNLHDQIFQRFYEKNSTTTNNLIKGTGIGLSLSRQLTEMHQGSLNVESEEGLGTTFILSIPLGNAHFQPSDIEKGLNSNNPYINDNVKIDHYIEYFKENSDKEINSENLTLLIVDDNKEILDYIQSIFQNDYNIIQAFDGEDGIEKVKLHHPDLIISDVMMPKIDGVNMCRMIKNNFETSHIPVLLLTAKSLLDDKLEGLDSGATDYISKPFHPEELRLKVKNILTQRQNIGKSIKSHQDFSPKDVKITTLDDEFLINLIRITEENISNPDFTMEDLAHHLAVSRALLFTKIKSLTSITPKAFLKSFRFKRAKQLLETHNLNISEISYQVGFKDPKYFSKVFQKEFGMSPTEYKSSKEPRGSDSK